VGIIIRQSIISSFYTYIGTIIGAFSILFAFPLFLSPEELGAFRLIIELGALLSGFGLLGIGQTIIRFYPFFREDNKSNGFLYLVLLLTVLGSVLVSILYFFFEEKLFDWFSRVKQYFSYIFIPIFLVAIFRIYQTVFENIAANHGKITTTNFFREILTRAGLLLLVFLYYKQSANNAFFSAVVVFLFIVALMPLFFHLMPKGEIYGECLFVVYLIGTAKLVESWGVGAITIISNSPYYFFGLLSAIINIILAIYLNYVLIPVYGINGAAFATMVTIFVSISIAVIIVRWKFKLSPIDLRQ